MKIHYGESEISIEAYKTLVEYDEDQNGILESETGEISEFEGFSLIQELQGFCVGITARNFDEFEIVPIATDECLTKEVSETVDTESPIMAAGGVSYSGEVISISGGTFQMGSLDKKAQSDERKSDGNLPTVTVSDFQIAKTEYTVGEARKLLESTDDESLKRRLRTLLGLRYNVRKTDQHPLAGATHDYAVAICKAYGGRLPTSAEIEYVAKGQSGRDKYGTPIDKAVIWENLTPEEKKYLGPREVCGPDDERANDHGVCDLAGNLWERTSDQYESDRYDSIDATDPSYPVTDQSRQRAEFRGGSFYGDRRGARSAFRFNDNANYRVGNFGFRVAWSLPQDSK